MNEEKKLKLILGVIILLLCAITIHPTAILFFLVVLCVYIKNSKLFVLTIIVFTLFLYYQLPFLSEIFVENTSGYQVYIEEADKNGIGTAIIYGSLWSFAIYYMRPFSDLKFQWLILYKILCFIVSFSIVSSIQVGGQTIPRLILYLTCFDCILIPYISTRIKNGLMKYVFLLLYLSMAFYQFAISERSAINRCELIF